MWGWWRLCMVSNKQIQRDECSAVVVHDGVGWGSKRLRLDPAPEAGMIRDP